MAAGSARLAGSGIREDRTEPDRPDARLPDGQAPAGAPSGASPTRSTSRANRRTPTRRYAGPSARGPRKIPGTPASARAAPTAVQRSGALGAIRSRYAEPFEEPPPSTEPAATAHHHSAGPSRRTGMGATGVAPRVHLRA